MQHSSVLATTEKISFVDLWMKVAVWIIMDDVVSDMGGKNNCLETFESRVL